MQKGLTTTSNLSLLEEMLDLFLDMH